MKEQLVSREGKQVPDVAFRVRRNGDWATVTTDEIFAKKNVVVFSLPGAFTPTCSSTHLPRFNELAPAFKAQGIDAIVCISVNDPFVMEEWGKDQEAANITLLPDGNGEFTEGMGMLVDKTTWASASARGAIRCWCATGPIEKMFIEPQKPGDPFEVSDADTMLDYINPKATQAGPGGDPDARRLLVLREGEGAAERRRLRLCGDSAAAHRAHEGARRDRRGDDGPANFHQRRADRRVGGARSVPAQSRVSLAASCAR